MFAHGMRTCMYGWCISRYWFVLVVKIALYALSHNFLVQKLEINISVSYHLFAKSDTLLLSVLHKAASIRDWNFDYQWLYPSNCSIPVSCIIKLIIWHCHAWLLCRLEDDGGVVVEKNWTKPLHLSLSWPSCVWSL